MIVDILPVRMVDPKSHCWLTASPSHALGGLGTA